MVASWALLAVVAAAPSAERPPRSLCVTIDDLPARPGRPLAEARDTTHKLLTTLQAHGVPAIGFVNEDKLLVRGEVDERIALLEAWLEAGMEIGNHNFGHLGLTHQPLASVQAAVLKGEVVTRWLLERRGKTPRYYRHPYTHTGPTAEVKAAFESFLKDNGYQVAPFTIEHDDFVFAAVYAEARQRGDKALATHVREAYLAHLDPAVDTFESMAEDLFGRGVAQILLIHANELNADSLDDMLRRLKERGYRFVTLDDALQDPAYASPDGFIGPYGPSWLCRWSEGLKRPTRRRGGPDPPPWIDEAYRALRRPPATP